MEFVTSGDTSGPVLVGLCSGAYHSVYGGLSPGAQGVCAINPVFDARPLPPAVTGVTPAATVASAAPPTVGPQRSSPVRRWVATVAERAWSKSVIGALPDGAWWVANRLGVRRSPVDALERLVDDGSDVMIIVGPDEAAEISKGAAGALRKLSRSDRFQLTVIDDLDHSMLGVNDERRVGDLVYRHVRDRFGQPDHTDDGRPGRGADDPLVDISVGTPPRRSE